MVGIFGLISKPVSVNLGYRKQCINDDELNYPQVNVVGISSYLSEVYRKSTSFDSSASDGYNALFLDISCISD